MVKGHRLGRVYSRGLGRLRGRGLRIRKGLGLKKKTSLRAKIRNRRYKSYFSNWDLCCYHIGSWTQKLEGDKLGCVWQKLCCYALLFTNSQKSTKPIKMQPSFIKI